MLAVVMQLSGPLHLRLLFQVHPALLQAFAVVAAPQTPVAAWQSPQLQPALQSTYWRPAHAAGVPPHSHRHPPKPQVCASVTVLHGVTALLRHTYCSWHEQPWGVLLHCGGHWKDAKHPCAAKLEHWKPDTCEQSKLPPVQAGASQPGAQL